MTEHDSTVFLGDSLTAFHDWSAFGSHHNAGIAGDTTDGLLQRLHYTLAKKPKTVVMMIGINDLLQGQSIETVKRNYEKIFGQLTRTDTVLILSLLPVQMTSLSFEVNEKVILLNFFLKHESSKKGFIYLDLYTTMIDQNGGLQNSLTSDGVHLTPQAYALWESALKARLETF